MVERSHDETVFLEMSAVESILHERNNRRRPDDEELFCPNNNEGLGPDTSKPSWYLEEDVALRLELKEPLAQQSRRRALIFAKDVDQ